MKREVKKHSRFRYCTNRRCGFTLIELMISIAIAGIIIAATYFSLDTALDSWRYSRDNLALQKVISGVMEEVTNGLPGYCGVKDSLEVVTAGLKRIEFIPPWIDDTHVVAGKEFIYRLNQKIKPGAGVPIGEVKLPGSNKYQAIPVKRIELEDANFSQVKLGIAVPSGSDLRFIYHPDPKAPDVIKKIWWDPNTQQVYSEDNKGIENISRNPFGVKVVKMQFHYYDNTNNLVSDLEWVNREDLNMVTGVEVYIEVQLGKDRIQNLISFINLRNAPMRSGYLFLHQGIRISIPNSEDIHSLLLSNISGVSSGDELTLELIPDTGKSWRINIKFENITLSKSVIESYTIEYPSGHLVYTEYPESNVESGLDLLTVGPNGLYDYDDDKDVDDFVLLKENVMLKVVKMDVEGAGLFIRP